MGLTYIEIAKVLRVTTRCLYKRQIKLGLANRTRGRKKL
jgi:hypothetical protein